MMPIESAEESEVGLGRARETLGLVARKFYWEEKLAELAEHGLSPENAAAFLKGRDDDLNRMSPLQFVRDERSFRSACTKLAQWQTQFGPR
ncbi:hypothetical protein [Aquamicrobium terrae]|uniref:DUF2384 domain-containing protein n=1 Tax=Aquamicrobium terrae TaxID=1324945 RepID=A0ABV2N0A5_9HYPH